MAGPKNTANPEKYTKKMKCLFHPYFFCIDCRNRCIWRYEISLSPKFAIYSGAIHRFIPILRPYNGPKTCIFEVALSGKLLSTPRRENAGSKLIIMASWADSSIVIFLAITSKFMVYFLFHKKWTYPLSARPAYSKRRSPEDSFLRWGEKELAQKQILWQFELIVLTWYSFLRVH